MKDWKDALSSLRSNLGEPPTDNEENVTEESTEIQKQVKPLIVVLDRKGRNGKIATIIEGFTIEQHKVSQIARDLKQLLGVGGSVREGEILIQGDHKQRVTQYLKEKNFKIK